MAGAGYKLFNTGDVLLASEVNTYLMQQTVMVFANATARTSALSGVLAEGMLSYLADTNATEVYDGSAWVSVSGTGDITAVTTGANSGLAGGVTTGNADIKINFASKGQLAVGTGSGTTDFLNVGTNGHTLVADSATATGLKWAAPAGSSGPAFYAYRGTSDQTGINQNTNTKIQFNAERFDTDSCFDTSTNYRFTPTKAGYYQININVWVGNGSNGTESYIYIYKNGAEDFWPDWNPNTNTPLLQGSYVVYLNGTTDYIEGFVYLNASSGTRRVWATETGSSFSGVWIRS